MVVMNLLHVNQVATTGGMMHAGAYQLPVQGETLLQGPSPRMPRLSLQTFTSDGALHICTLIGLLSASPWAPSAVASMR